jgi:transcriptional regulator with GAF, ATPase, and Fis domain
MPHLPSRKSLKAFADTVNAVVPSAILGFARMRPDARVSIFYWHSYGMGEYILDASDVLAPLSPSGDDTRQADAPALRLNPLRAVEWMLLFAGAERVVSFPVSLDEPGVRLWIGLSDPNPLASDVLMRLEAVAGTSAALLTAPPASDEATERLRRLELAAELLPAVLRVLDVREVFDRLSEIAKRALPHDLLILRLFSLDVSKITTLARTGGGADVDVPLPHAYPPAATRAWNFDLVDDHMAHHLDREMPPARMGARSSLRFPIRYDDRLIGGLGVMSFEPFKYSTVDIVVGRFLADHVAVALSHDELAQRLAEQARSNEELRARTTSLELLDELLATLVDSGDLSDVFHRISTIARKVLSHDAAALMVRLPDGRHARVHTTRNFPSALPDMVEVPEELVDNPEWEHDIFDDLTTLTTPLDVQFATMGLRSLLRVPIRLDGLFAGALIFLSNTPSAFRQADILVARRVAERLAVTLARGREIAASQRADEAAERAAKLEARVRALTEELDARTGYRRVVGESRQWRQVLTQATQVAATTTTVLLLGESGTGKEVVARFLHRGSSRNSGPFIALNCAALPEQLLEAELFGYERGAYTGATQSKPGQLEQASGGTLFLDEVAEMSPTAQAKFLRVLQEREFQRLGGTRVLRTDARVVAATNRDLERAIVNGQFREDLYYRLNVFPIRLPALRDRRDDILPLSEAFLGEIGGGLGRPPAGISRDARQLLMEYHWPGNVRELRNILERAAILCDGGLITAEHLALNAPPPQAPTPAREVPAAAVSAGPERPVPSGDLHSMERTMIQEALQNARFNKSKAAKALGLTRHQLYIRLRKHGFE